jgi:hypothetical protein
MEQELLTLPEHLSSPPVYSEVCVARSLVFCVSYFCIEIELAVPVLHSSVISFKFINTVQLVLVLTKSLKIQHG